MRAKIFLAVVVIICAALVYSVWQKETVLKTGKTFYMQLRPVDPRSIMQGDYMALRYAEDSKCLDIDEKGIGRNHNNCGKCIPKLCFKYMPSSFFFQEGHAHIYSQAKYAILKYNNPVHGNTTTAVLYGLADENLKELKP